MSNLLDLASIVLTPTAYNNGEALCIKPDDGSGDFQFSRNSAATRVNAQGLVENVQILSSNLVQNGDFSEEGAEEVSNGSFSQEGVQLITNGDFENGSTGWSFQLGWTFDNGQAHFENLGSSNRNLWQSPLVNGNWYKLTFEITAITSGYIRNVNSSVTDDTQFSTIGVHTQYFQAANVNLYLKASVDANLSIDNVSCVEVAQDWEIEDTWTIGDGVANGNGATGSTSELKQYNVNTIGKTYKATFEVLNYVSGTVGFWQGSGVSVINRSADGIYTEYFTATSAEIRFRPNSFNGSITNISVKEVGQNWTSEQGIWTFGDGVANGNGASGASEELGQNLSSGGVAVGDKVKLSFEIKNYASGSVQVIGITPTSSKSANGVYEYIGEVTSSNIRMRGSSFNGSITNISVIEITTDTSLPRINYEGFSYQDALGSEEISNGSFDTDTKWTTNTGWSISGGSANCDGTQGGNTTLVQQNGIKGAIIDFVVGKTYKVNFDIVVTSGQISNIEVASGYDSNAITTSGNHTAYITAVSTNDRFTFTANPSFIGSIDNVSVKEVLGQEVVPDSGCGSWLFEPQSTNLITQSELFSHSYWSKSNSNVTPNSTISPDGNTNATLMVGTVQSSTGSYIRATTTSATTIGQTYTLSLYVKPKGDSKFFKFWARNTDAGIIIFNLVDGTTDSPTTSTITNVGNGWFRVTTTGVLTTSIVAPYFYTYYSATESEGFYIWAAQIEQGNISSYIPTEGSTVTRNQDVCTNGGSLASINSTEGVLYAEISGIANDGTFKVISLSDGSTSNVVRFYKNTTDNQLSIRVTSSGVNYFNQIFTLSNSNATNKVALKYKENDFAFWVNGIEVKTDNNGITPIGLNVLNFSEGNGISPFFGKTKALAVWKEALSDSELQSLTTI